LNYSAAETKQFSTTQKHPRRSKIMSIEKEFFRYNTRGTWYKGNTHLHTTASDGGKTYTELADLYAASGYDFIVYTDHWFSSDVSSVQPGAPLLLIDGIELDGRDHTGAYYHVVCLGKTNGIQHDMDFEAAMQSARAQDVMIILAHPYWSGNTFDDANRWAFCGVEVYNNVCQWLNGKGNGAVHWNAMLEENPDILAFAVDDTHLRPDHPAWNGGWIVVNSSELSENAILKAIRKGNFYASCGPSFYNLVYDGVSLHIDSSPVRYVRLVGPGYRGLRQWAEDDGLLTTATLEIPANWDYVYLEIEDAHGRTAWTNTLFIHQ
jgi:hypothetical protein